MVKLEKNENIAVFFFGLLNNTVIPKLRNGSLKSIIFSLPTVIVRAATTKSTFYI
jgi:hypothetical protein